MTPAGETPQYDVVVIGCGMAGMAAAIRLGMYGKRVLLLERHNAPGGLNSFYFKGGRKCDVGLHAVTNYVEPGVKGTPLVKLLRQLRIPREALALCPQLGSKVAFSDCELRFGNGGAGLEGSIEERFGARGVEGYRALRAQVAATDPFAVVEGSWPCAREVMARHIREPLLTDMLLCPLMYYGSAREDDMDYDQFVIMWRALYEEGFGRPLEGVRVIIRVLLERLREVGVERRMRAGVRRIVVERGRAVGVELDDGACIGAGRVISTIGWPETQRLAAGSDRGGPAPVGRLTFVETLHYMDVQPQALGINDTIIFFNHGERFEYRQPEQAVDIRSGVICFPNNYAYDDGANLPEGLLRLTAMARYDAFNGVDAQTYAERKARWSGELLRSALAFVPRLTVEQVRARTQFADMFTPQTIRHYTGHAGGAIYGSAEKLRDGATGVECLHLAGTDQGFLGIVGAMLSGISIANRYGLAG